MKEFDKVNETKTVIIKKGKNIFRWNAPFKPGLKLRIMSLAVLNLNLLLCDHTLKSVR